MFFASCKATPGTYDKPPGNAGFQATGSVTTPARQIEGLSGKDEARTV